MRTPLDKMMTTRKCFFCFFCCAIMRSWFSWVCKMGSSNKCARSTQCLVVPEGSVSTLHVCRIEAWRPFVEVLNSALGGVGA